MGVLQIEVEIEYAPSDYGISGAGGTIVLIRLCFGRDGGKCQRIPPGQVWDKVLGVRSIKK